MLATMIMAAHAVEPAPPVPPSMTVVERAPLVVSDSEFTLATIGSCLRGRASVDLRRLWLLQNREVAIGTLDAPLTVTVERDKLRIAEAGEDARQRVRVWEIGAMLEDESGQPDVQLSLGVLDRHLVLYWRETFQNRIYRQGLFRITGRELVPLCEGRGGLARSH